ncbi:MAG: DUF481 domain-containing protein [Acidobacteria bacterium]|nr:DUF481 domain-containing protein [Acidobacteriota bacterium]
MGLSLTNGNSDTLNYNLTFDITRTPKARNVIELKALYLKGEQNGAVAVDRKSSGWTARPLLGFEPCPCSARWITFATRSSESITWWRPLSARD